MAKVLEVFEDYLNVHLIQELCTGGSVYERILERQYFTEQEAAVLVKHMLQALAPFHQSHLYHGSRSAGSAPSILDFFEYEVKTKTSQLVYCSLVLWFFVYLWDPRGLSPECFRFLNASPHAPLKLVDFGLELKAHRWNAVEHLSGPDLQSPCLGLRGLAEA